ncbi:MAG: hypothetical protein JWO36_2357 [Myxococcales bacterium]|nr:hypothetical protein [Myxococcales bacterium]
MRWIGVFVLCSCNQVFSLNATRQIDAEPHQFFDAPVDAPFTCPPIGTAPQFSNLLHQVIPQDCSDYTISASANRALGACLSPWGAAIAQGTVDGDLTVIIPTDTIQRYRPRLAPEGDTMLVYTFDPINGQAFQELAWDGASWTQVAVLPMPAQAGQITSPTRRPNRHVLIVSITGLDEYVDAGNNVWNPTLTHSHTQLGVINASSPFLSADGLRLIIYGITTGKGEAHAMYTDRTSVDSPFGAATPLTGVPTASDLFMTEDCSRIYMSGLQSIFYVQQR